MVTYYLCMHAENQIVIPEIKLITSRHVSIYIHLFFHIQFFKCVRYIFFSQFFIYYVFCLFFFLRVLNPLVMSQGNTNNRNFHFYSNELMYSIFFIVNIPAHNSKLCIQVSKQNFFVLRCQELVHIKLCKYNLAYISYAYKAVSLFFFYVHAVMHKLHVILVFSNTLCIQYHVFHHI